MTIEQMQKECEDTIQALRSRIIGGKLSHDEYLAFCAEHRAYQNFAEMVRKFSATEDQ